MARDDGEQRAHDEKGTELTEALAKEPEQARVTCDEAKMLCNGS